MHFIILYQIQLQLSRTSRGLSALGLAQNATVLYATVKPASIILLALLLL